MSKWIFSLFFSLSITCSAITCNAKTSTDFESIGNLEEVSVPQRPIFGKVTTPLKSGVSLYRYIPKKIYLESPIKGDTTIEKIETIALLPPTEKNDISNLEKKREELEKAELEGLNFIQPSLELSENEQSAIDEFFTRNEQEQLLNLWSSTIERNKTIQYIVKRLNPSNTPQESRSLLSKTVGAAIFLPFYAIQAFTNNSGAYYGSQVGSRVLGNVVEGKMAKNQTVLQLSQTEAIVLFMMIDEVAERLRQRFHNYKRLMVERSLASNELEEAKKDSLGALEQGAISAQILSNIQRRAIEREIRKIDSESRYFRNALIELAGTQAVVALDKQLELEMVATQNTPIN